MIILFVCVCVCMFKVYRALVFLIADPLYKAPFDVEFIYLFRRVGTRRRYPLFCPVLSVFWLLFFFFDLFSWSIEVFYFAQIIHKFCEGGGGHTGLLTFLCVTQFVFEWGVVMMLVGERKPNAPPLSVDSVNIKFDSLAPTYLLALFINSHC